MTDTIDTVLVSSFNDGYRMGLTEGQAKEQERILSSLMAEDCGMGDDCHHLKVSDLVKLVRGEQG